MTRKEYEELLRRILEIDKRVRFATVGGGGGGATLPIDLTTDVTGLLPLANLAPRTAAIQVTLDGSGSAIPAGVWRDIRIPIACTITKATLLADQTGSIVIDIWKDSYANYAPDVADTITASAKPTITSGIKSQDATLTGWTTSINAGDTLRFNVDSCTAIARVQLDLEVTIP